MYRPEPLAADDNSCSIAKGAAVGALTVGVTSEANMVTAVDGYVHHGTFSHVAPGTVLGITDLDDNTPGKVFDTAEDDILPFRTYMTVPASGQHIRGLVIGESDADISDPAPEEEDLAVIEGLDDDNDLVIESDSELALPLCDYSGRILRTLTVKPGVNRYTNIPTGFYIVTNFKFRIH